MVTVSSVSPLRVSAKWDEVHPYRVTSRDWSIACVEHLDGMTEASAIVRS